MKLSEFREEPGAAPTTIDLDGLSNSTFITLGTATVSHNGEDVSSKGRVLLLEVKKLDPSRRLGSPMIGSLKLTYE